MAEGSIEKNEIESKIFGIKVGQIRITKSIELWKEELWKENYGYYDLIIFRIPYEYGVFIRDVNVLNARYVGSIITYELDPIQTIYETNNCRSVDLGAKQVDLEDLNQCIRIGEESFISCSDSINRFNLDPMFSNDQIKKYYTEWVKNIFNKNSADEVIIYEEDSRIKGFISIGNGIGRNGIGRNGIREGEYNIPLNAVERKSRGKGIYKNMVHSVLNKMYGRVNIRTYFGNIGTEKVWKELGAEVKGIEHIFHLWV